jgi:hypothetical protein
MKHLKMLGLFAMAAALMAFAGSASAQTFTSPAGTEYTGNISSTLEGSALLKAGIAEITCTAGTVSGSLTTNANTWAAGSITGVSFSSCREGQTVDTLNNKGFLTILGGIHTASGTGTEVTTAVAGASCVYGLGETSNSLGTATNSGSGSTAKVTLFVNAKLPKISGGFLCANPASWTASYLVTSPSPSVLD